jgi:hypothetical protein
MISIQKLCLWTSYLLVLLCTNFNVSYSQDITNGLVSRYTFSGNANDTWGSNHLTAQGTPTLVTDRCGNPNSAYQFNGANALVDTTPLGVNNQSYTYCAWVRVTQNPANGNFVGIVSTRYGLTIQCDKAEVKSVEIQLYNAQGVLVYQGAEKVNTAFLTKNQLPSGIYTLQIISNSTIQSIRVIKAD